MLQKPSLFFLSFFFPFFSFWGFFFSFFVFTDFTVRRLRGAGFGHRLARPTPPRPTTLGISVQPIFASPHLRCPALPCTTHNSLQPPTTAPVLNPPAHYQTIPTTTTTTYLYYCPYRCRPLPPLLNAIRFTCHALYTIRYRRAIGSCRALSDY
ncbi:hypothetical protein GGS23DRAFT_61349 [Durotheca rogersii]|uniref:uncharacterized protein n=1 Tax=Durotheca rogersii TaxID=419775 RepID=UPI00221ED9F8|nr:uncharacterized protein GGS23DRAFT_61349 [Durotheca rogersii]KAI5863258.1 hypothetical protein GGS23DRAFT_61349 [Durotheca rogersii]